MTWGVVVLEAETLDEVGGLPGVWQVVVATGADRFYPRTGEALTAYRAADLTAQASLSINELSPASSNEQRGRALICVLDSDAKKG